MSLIVTQSLTKQYGARVTALDGLDIEVPDGVTGLVGANGAGKSTLIKILLGLLPSTSGSARVLDMDVASRGQRIRELVGYMPEHDCLPPDVTATELVVHLARMSGLPTTAARERAADTLRHVGLFEERYRPVGGYSTGMKQRVKLAQALVHDPQLVLLDEPTNGLDPAGRDDMLGLIRRIGTVFGISVVVTSHLMGELERICDHVVVIDGGRLMRSAATASMTALTQDVVVEVTDRGADVETRLLDAGLPVRRQGDVLHLVLTDDSTYDVVRDTVADLGVGLVRLQRGRQHMLDMFRDGQGGAA
jgi:ABC-2 type transport system ATP-binding protein